MRWLLNDVRTLEETQAILARKIGSSSLGGEGDWLSAAVVLRQSGELVGDVSLHWASEPYAQGELGFVFATAHHRVKGEWQSELVYAILAREWYDGSTAAV